MPSLLKCWHVHRDSTRWEFWVLSFTVLVYLLCRQYCKYDGRHKIALSLDASLFLARLMFSFSVSSSCRPNLNQALVRTHPWKMRRDVTTACGTFNRVWLFLISTRSTGIQGRSWLRSSVVVELALPLSILSSVSTPSYLSSVQPKW
jgi:hypothetical protein